MKRSPRNKLLIAALLFLSGTAIYLSFSDGPPRVRAATLAVQFIFLASLGSAAWAGSLKRSSRILAIVGVVILGSAGATYVDSLVIYGLYPLTPTYFVIGLTAFLLEASLFLSSVWFIDRALGPRR